MHATIAPGHHRVVVRSLGAAGASVVRVLARALPGVPESELAALVYRAPSELLTGVPAEAADRMAELLRSTGLSVAVEPADAPFAAGEGDHDVALVVRDVRRMAEVLRAVVDVTGLPPPRAKTLLLATPTVLLGKVSGATVEALRARFAPLDVEVDASRPAAARFDVFLGDCPAVVRAAAHREAASIAGRDAHPAPAGDALLAAGVDHASATALCERLRRTAAPLRILNRDFERFDLRIDAAPADERVVACIAETAGMPPDVARRVLAHLPVVTHESIALRDLEEHLGRLAALGVRASGLLVSLQTFALALDPPADAAAAARVVEAIADLPRERARALLSTRAPAVLEGPFASPQARWLAWELSRVGTRARMIAR